MNVETFLLTQCVFDENCFISTADLYEKYRQWLPYGKLLPRRVFTSDMRLYAEPRGASYGVRLYRGRNQRGFAGLTVVEQGRQAFVFPDLVDLNTAARILRSSPSEIYEKVVAGELPALTSCTGQTLITLTTLEKHAGILPRQNVLYALSEKAQEIMAEVHPVLAGEIAAILYELKAARLTAFGRWPRVVSKLDLELEELLDDEPRIAELRAILACVSGNTPL